jgi:hypothetical protein
VWLHAVLTSTVGEGEESASLAGRFTPEKNLLSIIQGPGWPTMVVVVVVAAAAVVVAALLLPLSL